MKFLIIIAVFVAAASAQRPSFAGSGIKASTLGSSSSSAVNLNSRFNAVDGTSERIPIDARGDVDLVNRIKTWPRENWPYWYINSEAIEKQRGTSVRNDNVQTNQSTTSNGAQLQNRFGDNSGQIDIQNKLSFTTVIGNQQKTYEYDPVTDAWYAKKN